MNKESPLSGRNILVVDDDSDLRSALIFDLMRRGCNMFEAANGSDAIEIIKKEQIDIVISDVRMPNGDGIELLKQIRIHNPSKPPVVLATGYADITEPEALDLGAYAIIEKPIDRQHMLGLLEKACGISV